MKIKVYADWNHEEILSEKDYKEFKDRKVNEITEEYFEDNCEFEEFLAENDYRLTDIFKMTDEQKGEVRSRWREWCKESAENAFENEYSYEEIEIEV